MEDYLNQKTILILGGYGNTGRALARLLLKESSAKIVIAGRNATKSEQLASELNSEFTGDKVRGVRADASDVESLRQVFDGMDIVVVASSTTQYTRQVASTALEMKIGYLDIQLSTPKVELLKSMAGEIKESGCCFITDGGFHPGLPGFLVRFAAHSFDQLEFARVGSVIKEDWKSLNIEDCTVYELLELMNDFDMSVFKNGRWKKAGALGISDFISMDFGGEFGEQHCAPMLLEEMRVLPDVFPTLKDTGFYVGSFNWFVDWIIMPIAFVAMKAWPETALRPMSRWMTWGLKTFSKPPYGTILKVEAAGLKDGKPAEVQVMISHPDGYQLTAIPVAACLLQYLDGTIAKPGLWLQAHIVEVDRFMLDMQRMGIKVQTIKGAS